MALVNCHECKKEISSEAKACPHCGAAPPKGIGIGGWFLIVVVGAVAYSATKGGGESTPAPKPASEAEKRADDELNRAIAAATLLKQATKDPSSFKLESLLLFSGGAACYEWRAKNSFGAIVPAKAVFTPPGSMLTSDRDGNRFVRAWNQTCTKADGQERAAGLNFLGAF